MIITALLLHVDRSNVPGFELIILSNRVANNIVIHVGFVMHLPVLIRV